jgi:hypothetical protein
MIFLQKYFYAVFELPLPRNAQKRTKTNQEKTILGLVGSSEVDQIYVKARHFFFRAGGGRGVQRPLVSSSTGSSDRVPASSRGPAWALFAKTVPIEAS